MHELLAPLLYVLHVDIQRLAEVKKLYEDQFIDKFDELSFDEVDHRYHFDFERFTRESEPDSQTAVKIRSIDELDPKIQKIILLSDAYGAEGELGVVLSDKFMEHDAFTMLDALMSGGGSGVISMADFFSHSPLEGARAGMPPVIEASAALYHLLSTVDSSLYSHLIELGVEPQYFALRWFRVLFGREFELRNLLVIWDEIFMSDNSKLDGPTKDDTFKLLGSRRGAFIAAIAVSMILYLRSSLLATEYATSCLQRLLNFPEEVDINKLMAKARSLQVLALDSNVRSSSSAPLEIYSYERSKSLVVVRSHVSDSVSPKTPKNVVPESYWEEKWRDLHKEEELKKSAPVKKKRWSDRLRLSFSRTESDKSPSKASSSAHEVNSPLSVENEKKDGCSVEIESDVRSYSGITGSEENSSIFSDLPSPPTGDNETEKSSICSNVSTDENEDSNNELVEEESCLKSELSKDKRVKFQWFWKRNSSEMVVSSSDKGEGGSVDGGLKVESSRENSFGSVGSDGSCTNPPVGCSKDDLVDEKVMMGTLKNLGHSMLEHIQVIKWFHKQDNLKSLSLSLLCVKSLGRVCRCLNRCFNRIECSKVK